MNEKRFMHRLTLVKLRHVQDKEKMGKASEEKKMISKRSIIVRLIPDFSLPSMEARLWNYSFNVPRKQNGTKTIN